MDTDADLGLSVSGSPSVSRETGDRPGRILTDTIYGVWCDICDEHLGDKETYQEASIALTTHLDCQHDGWDLKPRLSHGRDTTTASGKPK